MSDGDTKSQLTEHQCVSSDLQVNVDIFFSFLKCCITYSVAPVETSQSGGGNL